jgi:hypothetical protein
MNTAMHTAILRVFSRLKKSKSFPLQVGDIVTMSPRNKWRGSIPSAYNGMKGEVKEILPDNSFILYTQDAWLIVPKVSRKKRWVLKDGVEIRVH